MSDIYGIIYIHFLVVLFGVCIGSFLNVVIYRLPKGIFLSKSRSMCPACEKTLGPLDLVPIFSYLFLKGRCRHCGARISPRYLLVELFCALLAAASFVRFGFDLKTLVVFGVSVILLAVALIDHDTMEIPDSLSIAIIPFAVGAIWIWRDVPLLERAIGLVTVSLPMLLIAFIIKDAFGGGDIKLMAVCGFLLGWQVTLAAFFIALLTGGVYGIYLRRSGKLKKGAHFAFGPHLCAGVAVSLFFGADIVRLYLSLYPGL